LSRSTRAKSATAAAFPRIVERKPRRGDVHPLSPTAIRAFLARPAGRAAPRPASRRAARARRRRRRALRHLPPRGARHHPYSLPPTSGGCRRSTGECAARSAPRRRHHRAPTATACRSTSPGWAWICSCATCWRTRSATTCAIRRWPRYPRVGRTADEEAGRRSARAPHARAPQFTVTSSEPSRPQKLASRIVLGRAHRTDLAVAVKVHGAAGRTRGAARARGLGLVDVHAALGRVRGLPQTAAAPAPRRRRRRSACRSRTRGDSADTCRRRRALGARALGGRHQLACVNWTISRTRRIAAPATPGTPSAAHHARHAPPRRRARAPARSHQKTAGRRRRQRD